MKIELNLIKDSEIILPLHYNHILQATLYNLIDSKLANFLHNEGFGDSRKFKMFTFSRLYGKYRIDMQEKKIIFNKEINLIITSPYGKFCQSLANGVIKNKILLGENLLEIREASLTPIEVDIEEIIVETLSPIVVYSTMQKHNGEKYTVYFSPEEKEFETQINDNLYKKYQAFYGNNEIDKKLLNSKVKIKLISKTKQHIINYKDFIIKAYSGRFLLNGPKELLKFGLEAGLGAKNSMGFGCVSRIEGKILKNT